MSDEPLFDGDDPDEDPTTDADLDWDLEERDRFLAQSDPGYEAPVDVLVEADE